MSYLRAPNTVFAGNALSQTPDKKSNDPSGVVSITINANVATTSSLGVVQIGDNIDVSPEGVISVTDLISGPTGPTGPQGSSNACIAILVDSSYAVQPNVYYVGVNSAGPVTITLLPNATDCTQIIIKAEEGAPMGNRKITIVTGDGSNIDGSTSYVIEVPYQAVRMLCRGGNWHII